MVSDSAIKLLSNYFDHRKQAVKLGLFVSPAAGLFLGVPQGSIIGPLLFFIYINDLHAYDNEIDSLLFADDTTILASGNDFKSALANLKSSSTKLIDWSNFNRLILIGLKHLRR